MENPDDNHFIGGEGQIVEKPSEVYKAIEAANLPPCANCGCQYGNVFFGMSHWCPPDGLKKMNTGRAGYARGKV